VPQSAQFFGNIVAAQRFAGPNPEGEGGCPTSRKGLADWSAGTSPISGDGTHSEGDTAGGSMAA
jgi:hypothetical protein